jgi:hypothetical protein
LEAAVTVSTFDRDDVGYLRWLATHPSGYVINILRSLNASTARLHQASCRTIGGQPRAGRTWTGPYLKVCADAVDVLDGWALEHAGGIITCCGTCQPSASGLRADASKVTSSAGTSPPPKPARRLVRGQATEIAGPWPDRPMVEAWADEYIRFERRPVEQEQLRAEIRTRLGQLTATPDQVLHTTFFGAKHPAADVENLALYYIDDTGASFANAARYGLRFELATDLPPSSPIGRDYAYGYRYELLRRDTTCRHWRQGRELASWDWVSLGVFAGPKKLEQVWLSLQRHHVHVADPARAPSTPFAVRVAIQPPQGVVPRLGYLLKGIVDGVVCALQAHTDRASVGEVATRVSNIVEATPDEIETLMVRQDRAVLGVVPRLLHKRGAGVIWTPSDDLCLAGELLAAHPAGPTWSLRGRVLELMPA